MHEKHGKSNQHEEATAYVEGFLAGCKACGATDRFIAERLGAILSASRPGTKQRVPKLRKNYKRNKPGRKTLESVARNGRTHRVSPAGKKKMKDGIKTYWAKMTPEERSVEMKRRQQIAAKKKEVA